MRDRAQTNSGFADVVRLAQRKGCLVSGNRKNGYGWVMAAHEYMFIEHEEHEDMEKALLMWEQLGWELVSIACSGHGTELKVHQAWLRSET